MTDDGKAKLPVNNFSSTTNYENKIPIEGVETLHEKEYNPYEHRNLEHSNTFSGALMHLIKSSLGTGILAMPSAVAATGIVVGGVGSVLTGILCAHTIRLLVCASQEICKKDKIPMLGFSETAQAVFKRGPKTIQPWANFAKLFVEIALLLTLYSTSAVFLVFISDNIRKMVNYYHPSVEDWAVQYYTLMLLILLIPCCQIRQLKHLVPFSLIANTTTIIAFGITLYYMLAGVGDINMEDRKLYSNVTQIPFFFSTVLFAMESIGAMLPIENTMKKPQFLGCCGVLNLTMGFVVTLYPIIGLFGYIKFGDNVDANLIAELPDEEIASQVAKICIVVAVFFSFMLEFFIPCDITCRKIEKRVPEKYRNIAQIVLRVVLVLFVTAIATAVPKLEAIISLVGSVFSSTLGLFIPAFLDIILKLGNDGDFGFMKWRLWKNIFVALLSWFALFSGSYYAVKRLTED